MPQTTSQAALAPGTVLTRRYRIVELIGSGGYACVYRATDLTFGYDRAIKEVSDPDRGVREQFRLEAELLINSRHPNIPHGYHIIEDMGRLFLVMDFVEGKDLEELLNESLTQRARPLDEAQVLRWAIEICSALDEMHNLRMPVIHRDIKPANIKITPDDRPILIDFGLAKLHHKSNPTMTAAQGVSPGFAPPEQYMAKGRTDARTDIYGLGATLYASLTGKDPPEAPSRLLAQTGSTTLGATLNPLRRMNPRVSEETERVVMRALELSPNNRQQSARQLQNELQAALDHLSGGGKASGEATMVMGDVCPRCGTQNRPGASRCVQCNTPLGAQNPRAKSAGPSSLESTGKRAAVVATPGGRTNARMPVPGPNRPAVPPNGNMDQRTGRQPAVVNQRSCKQPAVVDPRTGKQKALTPEMDGRTTAGSMAAARPGGPGQMPDRSLLPQPATANAARDRMTAILPETSAPKGWIRFGKTPLSRFGKAMLTLSAVETLWGVFILVLGVVAIANAKRELPWTQLIAGWLVVALLASVLGAQAMNRPVFRRGKLTSARRWVQGIFLTLYTLAVHGVAVWGATIFAHGQGDGPSAVIAFMLFGVNVLVVGALAVINTLG